MLLIYHAHVLLLILLLFMQDIADQESAGQHIRSRANCSTVAEF